MVGSVRAGGAIGQIVRLSFELCLRWTHGTYHRPCDVIFFVEMSWPYVVRSRTVSRACEHT